MSKAISQEKSLLFSNDALFNTLDFDGDPEEACAILRTAPEFPKMHPPAAVVFVDLCAKTMPAALTPIKTQNLVNNIKISRNCGFPKAPHPGLRSTGKLQFPAIWASVPTVFLLCEVSSNQKGCMDFILQSGH